MSVRFYTDEKGRKRPITGKTRKQYVRKGSQFYERVFFYNLTPQQRDIMDYVNYNRKISIRKDDDVKQRAISALVEQGYLKPHETTSSHVTFVPTKEGSVLAWHASRMFREGWVR